MHFLTPYKQDLQQPRSYQQGKPSFHGKSKNVLPPEEIKAKVPWTARGTA